MHVSKDSMWREIWKILQNFLGTKQGLKVQHLIIRPLFFSRQFCSLFGGHRYTYIIHFFSSYIGVRIQVASRANAAPCWFVSGEIPGWSQLWVFESKVSVPSLHMLLWTLDLNQQWPDQTTKPRHDPRRVSPPCAIRCSFRCRFTTNRMNSLDLTRKTIEVFGLHFLPFLGSWALLSATLSDDHSLESSTKKMYSYYGGWTYANI